MLKIAKTTENGESAVEIDYYVPFKILFGSGELENHICWRIGDFDKSILEFSIGQKSKLLKEVTLVAASKVCLTNERLEEIDEKKSGIPTIEFQETKNQLIYDNCVDFETVLCKTYIKVFWSEKIKSQLKIGRILLGVDDDNNLTSITITELSDFEHEELKAGLKL